MLLALIWRFDFPPFMVLIIAILNDGTIMTISKDRMKPSPQLDSWKLAKFFVTGVILGGYLAMMTNIITGILLFSLLWRKNKYGVLSRSTSRTTKWRQFWLDFLSIMVNIIYSWLTYAHAF